MLTLRKQIELLKDVYDRPAVNGIFKSMINNLTLQKLLNEIGVSVDTVMSIDFDYIYNRSGEKKISNLLYCMIYSRVEDDNGTLVIDDKKFPTWNYLVSDIGNELINSLIATKFSAKWQKLIDTVFLQYDVISPFNITLTETSTGKDTNSGTDSVKSVTGNTVTDNGTVNNTTTDNGSVTNTETVDLSDSRSIYGYNSQNPSPSDITSKTGTDKDETKSNNTRGVNGTNSNTRTVDGTVTDTKDYGHILSREANRDYTRKGNIGNRSFSELIDDERKTVQFIILESIYSDLDSVLTRGRYGRHEKLKFSRLNYKGDML